MCVNTKKTYKTKTTKGTRQNGMEDERDTHSKDKFLNLNSDPTLALPTSRVFGTFCRHGGGRGKEREGERDRAKWFSFP